MRLELEALYTEIIMSGVTNRSSSQALRRDNNKISNEFVESNSCGHHFLWSPVWCIGWEEHFIMLCLPFCCFFFQVQVYHRRGQKCNRPTCRQHKKQNQSVPLVLSGCSRSKNSNLRCGGSLGTEKSSKRKLNKTSCNVHIHNSITTK